MQDAQLNIGTNTHLEGALVATPTDVATAIRQDLVPEEQNLVLPFMLDAVLLTHLHSDHTLGYPDLILTPWVMGRTALDVYGQEPLPADGDHQRV